MIISMRVVIAFLILAPISPSLGEASCAVKEIPAAFFGDFQFRGRGPITAKIPDVVSDFFSWNQNFRLRLNFRYGKDIVCSNIPDHYVLGCDIMERSTYTPHTGWSAPYFYMPITKSKDVAATNVYTSIRNTDCKVVSKTVVQQTVKNKTWENGFFNKLFTKSSSHHHYRWSLSEDLKVLTVTEDIGGFGYGGESDGRYTYVFDRL